MTHPPSRECDPLGELSLESSLAHRPRAGRRRLGLRCLTVTLSLGAAAGAVGDRPDIPPDTLPQALPTVVPLGLDEFAEVERDAALETLGRKLFFAPELSRDRTIACASCHRPELGFADDHPLSRGVDGALTVRNTPSLWNKALEPAYSWDGSKATLEQQVLAPIAMPNEMDLPVSAAVERLGNDAGWVRAFEAATGAAPSEATLARALSAFVRGLWFGDTPVDRFRDGDVAALTPEEQSGLWLFEAKAGCWRCHSGPNFSDGEFHDTGVGAVDEEPVAGRFAVTNDPADRGHFKTPGLRALTLTPPYMHDGSLATLEDVVAFYARGGGPNANLSSEIRPFEVSEREAANLVAFLRALSRPGPPAPTAAHSVEPEGSTRPARDLREAR